jgi:hypothetical protein
VRGNSTAIEPQGVYKAHACYLTALQGLAICEKSDSNRRDICSSGPIVLQRPKHEVIGNHRGAILGSQNTEPEVPEHRHWSFRDQHRRLSSMVRATSPTMALAGIVGACVGSPIKRC